MAKLALKNGTHKVAEVHINATGECSGTRVHFVLRSDNKVLIAMSTPSAAEAYYRKRTGYSVHGTLKVERVAAIGQVEAFLEWARKRADKMGSPLVIKS